MLEKRYQAVLDRAGIKINGDRAWDIQVHNKKLWGRLLRQGMLGFGESYMDGWWDVENLDEFFYRVTRHVLSSYQPRSVRELFLDFMSIVRNPQTRKRSMQVGEQHYDVGNDLYQCMLGPSMAYTCAYWKDAKNLEEAQENKLRLIGDKLMLKPGMRVLDIGCGFGSAMAFFSENYGVEVVGVTISKEQMKYADEHYGHLPIDVRVMDYRDITEQFDRIYSIGMFEHVGYRNYKTYMRVCSKALLPDGLMLLHTIGTLTSDISPSPWIQKYIFPNSMLPSIKQIANSTEGLFVIEDMQNFGFDYHKTLQIWSYNFEANWKQLSDKYDERFHRMWHFYLQMCIGSFRSRYTQLYQFVLSPKGIEGRYDTPR